MKIYFDDYLFFKHIQSCTPNSSISHNILNEYDFKNGNGLCSILYNMYVLFEGMVGFSFSDIESLREYKIDYTTFIEMHHNLDVTEYQIQENFRKIQMNHCKDYITYYDVEEFCTQLPIHDLSKLMSCIYISHNAQSDNTTIMYTDEPQLSVDVPENNEPDIRIPNDSSSEDETNINENDTTTTDIVTKKTPTFFDIVFQCLSRKK